MSTSSILVHPISVLGVSEREVLINIAKYIFEKDTGKVLVALDKILSQGKSPLVLASDLISYFRDLLLVNSLGNNSREIVVVRDDIFSQMSEQAISEYYCDIVNAIEILSSIEQDLRYSVKPRTVLETAVIKIINDNSLIKRVEQLEEIVKKFPR